MRRVKKEVFNLAAARGGLADDLASGDGEGVRGVMLI